MPADRASHAYIASMPLSIDGFWSVESAIVVAITRSDSQLMLRLLTCATMCESGSLWCSASVTGSRPSAALAST